MGKTVQFRLGCSVVTGQSRLFAVHWDHILRFRVDHGGTLERAIRRITHWLPRLVQGWVRAWFPGPFLPDTVLIKELKAPDWEKEFNNEIKMYRRLRPIQGRAVPIFYGETKIEGTRALVMEYVDGRMLGAQAMGGEAYRGNPIYRDPGDQPFVRYSEAEIEVMIRKALTPILELGVEPSDITFSNFLLASGGRGVFVDHEQDELLSPETNVAQFIDVQTEDLMDWYRRFKQMAEQQKRTR